MKKKISKILLMFFLTAFTALAITGGVLCKSNAQAENPYESLSIFTEAMKKVRDFYWTDTNTKDLIYGAISGMLSSLDRYSNFMTPEQFRDMQAETRGSFGGIGIEITIKDGILTVVSPLEDTPAFRAGVRAGDKIIEIDGQSTQHITLYEAVRKLRGQKGTKVTITILREGIKAPKKITLVREIIMIKSVKFSILEPGYGYVRITQFQERTSSDLSDAIKNIQKTDRLKGLVLDLRSNPGGLLDQAIKVADLFLESGLIVYTDGRLESQKQRFEAQNGDDFDDFNMIILIDQGSASASEIVAGALRDNRRAVLLGTKTFGKGTVQTIYQMQDGSAMRLTTAHYYTPSGQSIEEKGITPDITVEPQRIRDEEEEPSSNLREIDIKRDVQLQRALDYLKSWYIFSSSSKDNIKAHLEDKSPEKTNQ